MEQARESGAKMVVFPELAIDRFFPLHEECNAREIAEPIPGPTTRAIGAKAKSYACFHEQAYYNPGDTGARVYDTAVGRVGVAICYDRHYPEYIRFDSATTLREALRAASGPGAAQAAARAFRGPLARSGLCGGVTLVTASEQSVFY